MADQKITDFSADGSPAVADLVVTAKSPFGAGSNRKVTLANMKALMLATPTITGHATIEGVTAAGVLSLTGDIGTTGTRITKGWFADLAATAATLGAASTDTITCTGRMVLRTLGSDPQDATPASRPAGTVAEMAYYSGKMYFCTNASTPTWELITSV